MIKIKIKLKKSIVFTDTNDNQLDNIFRGKKILLTIAVKIIRSLGINLKQR